MMNEELRLYSFNHYKLQGIHAGIQCQHATQEMNNSCFLMETFKMEKAKYLMWWANNWKTTIVLNGGNSKALYEILNFLSTEDNPYPWSYFHESEDDMEGILTNIVIVVPEKVFGLKDRLKDCEDYNPRGLSYQSPKGCYIGMTEFDIKLAELIQSKPLMR
jgi:hypothetical protein